MRTPSFSITNQRSIRLAACEAPPRVMVITGPNGSGKDGLDWAERTFSRHENFAAPDYHLKSNVTLELECDTAQIDHILKPGFGAFDINTKNDNGEAPTSGRIDR